MAKKEDFTKVLFSLKMPVKDISLPVPSLKMIHKKQEQEETEIKIPLSVKHKGWEIMSKTTRTQSWKINVERKKVIPKYSQRRIRSKGNTCGFPQKD